MVDVHLAEEQVVAVLRATRQRTGMRGSTWIDPNGTRWPLHEVPTGVLLGPGIQGIYDLAIDRYKDDTIQPGSRPRGTRAQERDVFWPLLIHTSGGAPKDWEDTDHRFFAGMDPDRDGTWEWVSSKGVTRRLRCRWVDTPEVPQKDPSRKGLGVYGVKLVAHQPYWEGDPVSYEFSNLGTGVEFWPTATKGFQFSGGRNAASASVTTDGDVPAWPVWTLRGPIDAGALVGVGDRLTRVPWAIGAGAWVRLDMRAWGPLGRGAWDSNGVNRTGDLAAQFRPAPVPVGAQVPITVNMVGTGSVSVELTPRFRRAW